MYAVRQIQTVLEIYEHRGATSLTDSVCGPAPPAEHAVLIRTDIPKNSLIQVSELCSLSSIRLMSLSVALSPALFVSLSLQCTHFGRHCTHLTLPPHKSPCVRHQMQCNRFIYVAPIAGSICLYVFVGEWFRRCLRTLHKTVQSGKGREFVWITGSNFHQGCHLVRALRRDSTYIC